MSSKKKTSNDILESIHLLPTKLRHNYDSPVTIMKEAKELSSISKNNIINIFMNDSTQSYWKKSIDLIKNDPEMTRLNVFETSKEELRKKAIYCLIKTWRHLGFNYEEYLKIGKIPHEFMFVMGMASMDAGTRFGVHIGLYTKSLLALGTKKHEKYKKRALEMTDLGCFMLTEMGHGSNVQGILTLAVYHESEDCFIINTPHDIGMKFWIGNLAKTANMGVLFAQLIVKGVNEGVHAFLIPIRDEEGNVLPGMIIGDCGTKMGLNGVDNGWVVFKSMRLPRDALLDRFSTIDENGKFKSQIQKRSLRFAIQISALTGGRLSVALGSGVGIFAGCSIALRYCTVRRQFGEQKGMENTLMDYPLVNSKLAQFLSLGISFYFSSFLILNECDHINISKIKDIKVKEIHTISSYLKVASTWARLKTLRKIRELCGGHGYSTSSFIPTMLNYAEVGVTWEGGNEVLIQQTAKNLMEEFNVYRSNNQIRYKSLHFLDKFEHEKVDIEKTVEAIKEFAESVLTGELSEWIKPPSNSKSRKLNISDCKSVMNKLEDFSEHLLIILQLRVFEMMDRCLAKFGFYLTEVESTKGKFFHSFNKSLPGVLIPTAIFYGELFCFETCSKWVSFLGNPNNSAPFFTFIPHFKNLNEEKYINEKLFLRKINILFACSTLSTSDKFLNGVHESIDYEFFDCLGDIILKMSESIKYDMLTFADFIFPDGILPSSLGSMDGDVYNNIKQYLYSNPSHFGKSPSWDLIKKLKQEK